MSIASCCSFWVGPIMVSWIHSTALSHISCSSAHWTSLTTSAEYGRCVQVGIYPFTQKRRACRRLMIGMTFIIAGSTILAAAQNVAMLFVARVLLGIGQCTIQSSIPVFIAETSPAHARGLFLGMLSTYVSSSSNPGSCGYLRRQS